MLKNIATRLLDVVYDEQGDPQFDDVERRLAAISSITVPTITLSHRHVEVR